MTTVICENIDCIKNDKSVFHDGEEIAGRCKRAIIYIQKKSLKCSEYKSDNKWKQ
jgi:hypothetical protein